MKNNHNPIANSKAVLREEFDNWAILFNPETGDAVGVNAMGAFIWKLLDGRGVDKIVEEVNRRFSEIPDAVDEEVKTFLNKLIQYGLVGYEVNDRI